MTFEDLRKGPSEVFGGFFGFRYSSGIHPILVQRNRVKESNEAFPKLNFSGKFLSKFRNFEQNLQGSSNIFCSACSKKLFCWLNYHHYELINYLSFLNGESFLFLYDILISFIIENYLFTCRIICLTGWIINLVYYSREKQKRRWLQKKRFTWISTHGFLFNMKSQIWKSV